MSGKNQREDLVKTIGFLLDELKEASNGAITQSDLAKLLDISAVTLSRAKSLHYQLSLHTLSSLKKDLESLLRDFQKDPDLFLDKLADKNHAVSSDQSDELVKKVEWMILKLENIAVEIDEKTKSLPSNRDKPKYKLTSGIQKNGKPKMLAGLIIIAMLLIVSWRLFFFDEKPSFFEYSFDENTNIQDFLEKENLVLENPDYNYISLEEGRLKLHTLAGDNWVKEGEEPKITNLLVKEVNCKECIVNLTIQDFKPNQPWQQTALFFFDEKDGRFDLLRFVRFCYSHGPGKPSPPGDNSGGLLQTVEKTSEELAPNTYGYKLKEQISFLPKQVVLRVKIDKNNYTFYWSHNVAGLKQVHSIPRLVEPKYIGLAAFHGISLDDYTPLNADSIPAFIDHFVLKPLR